MNKFELYAINYFLNEFPENWEFVRIINHLCDDDFERNLPEYLHKRIGITPFHLYQALNPKELAQAILDMSASLRNNFSDIRILKMCPTCSGRAWE